MINFLSDSLVVGIDIHKKNKPTLPTSGGLCFGVGTVSGIFAYVTIQTFVFKNRTNLIELLAVVLSILIALFIGFLDDIGIRREGREIKRFGIKRWQKTLLTLPAAIPLMAIKAGESQIVLPFIGLVDAGIFFPLILIPLGIVGCTNMVNMFAGFNGSEAGMGIIYLSSIAIYSYTRAGGVISFIICLCTISALLGYIKYNLFPAKILPGDSSTYVLGAIAGCTIIMANIERAGIVIMFPFIVEGILKFRSLVETGNFAGSVGILGKDGKIESKYKKIYSTVHIFQKVGMTEKQITYSMWGLCFIFAVIPHLIW